MVRRRDRIGQHRISAWVKTANGESSPSSANRATLGPAFLLGPYPDRSGCRPRVFAGVSIATIGAVILLGATAAVAQTQIDLAVQAKRVDFSAASATKPMKSGTSTPATCAAGEMFFNSNAPAGQNLFGCVATNIWALQGDGGTGGGEANTASNVGNSGIGLFHQKATFDLEFRKINTASSKISLALGDSNRRIDVDVVPGNILFTSLGLSGTSATQLVGVNAGNTALESKTLSLGSTGSDANIVHAANSLTLHLPTASGSARGLLSSSHWTTFNNKQAALGFTPENSATKGASNGYAGLDSTQLLVESVKRIRTGTSDPGTCTVGEVLFRTDLSAGQNLKGCTSTNTWTLLGDGGAGGGSGTVSSGETKCYTYYPSTAAAVDDARNGGNCAVAFDPTENTTTYYDTAANPTLRIDGDDGSITILTPGPWLYTGRQQPIDPSAPSNSGDVSLYFLNGRPKFRANGGAATDVATGDANGAATLAPVEAYDVTGWNGDTAPPQKDAVRDKIETLPNTGTCTSQVVTALNAAATPTCASIATAMIANDNVTRDKVEAKLRTISFSFALTDPSTGENGVQQMLRTHAFTITRVSCSVSGGGSSTATINLEERAVATPHTAGTEVLTSDLVCDENSAASTTFTNAGIAGQVPLALHIASVANAPTSLQVHVEATID